MLNSLVWFNYHLPIFQYWSIDKRIVGNSIPAKTERWCVHTVQHRIFAPHTPHTTHTYILIANVYMGWVLRFMWKFNYRFNIWTPNYRTIKRKRKTMAINHISVVIRWNLLSKQISHLQKASRFKHTCLILNIYLRRN